MHLLNKNGKSWTLIYSFADSQHTASTHTGGANKQASEVHHPPVAVAGQFCTALYAVRWNWGLISEKTAPGMSTSYVPYYFAWKKKCRQCQFKND